MPIVFNRVFAFCKSHKLPLLPLTHRQDIGRVIAQEYFRSGINKYIYRVEKREPHGIVKVLFYPKEFRAKMDQIISDYIVANNLHKLPERNKKK